MTPGTMPARAVVAAGAGAVALVSEAAFVFGQATTPDPAAAFAYRIGEYTVLGAIVAFLLWQSWQRETRTARTAEAQDTLSRAREERMAKRIDTLESYITHQLVEALAESKSASRITVTNTEACQEWRRQAWQRLQQLDPPPIKEEQV